MPPITPDEDELRSRILAHLEVHPGSPFVAAVWNGYLAGLVEWGLLDGNAHARLTELVPDSGGTETVEVLLGTEYAEAQVGEHREAPRPGAGDLAAE